MEKSKEILSSAEKQDNPLIELKSAIKSCENAKANHVFTVLGASVRIWIFNTRDDFNVSKFFETETMR